MAKGGARKGAGRPPGARNRATNLHKNSIEDLARQHTDTAINALNEIAGNGQLPPAARVSAAIALLDRGYGKPGQSITHKGDEDAPLNLGVVFVGSNPNDLIKDEEPEGGEGEEE